MKLKYSYNTVEKFLKEYVKDYKALTNGELAINSPFTSDTTYDCRINIDKQCFHDWESDEHGNIEELAAAVLKVERDEARNVLLKYGLSGIELQQQQHKEPEIIDVHEIEMPPRALSFNRDDRRGSIHNLQKAQAFLLKKLVHWDMAKKYKLKWTEMSYLQSKKDPEKKWNLSYRILIPSYEGGKLVYYQARDYTEQSDLRYKNPPKEIQPKSIVVPFYDQIIPNEILFISEGPWEAIQYGGTYMLGPVISDRQIYKLKKKNPKAIYFIPDNDATGRLKLAANLQHLHSFMTCPIFVVKWWKGELAEFKDPIDAGLKYDDLINADYIEVDRNIELKIRMGI